MRPMRQEARRCHAYEGVTPSQKCAYVGLFMRRGSDIVYMRGIYPESLILFSAAAG